MSEQAIPNPLKGYFERTGISIAHMARMCGTTPQTIHRIRAASPEGAGHMQAGLFLALRDIMEVDYTDFITQ